MLSILAIIVRGETKLTSKVTRKFAIVVPAHNEELSIEKTLRSLGSLDYPQYYFDIIVVADNCTDRTGEIARTQNAIVYERTNDKLRGKGYALRWCFDVILSKKPSYDAIVVIDADSVISKNYLSVMNAYLENGSKAIQSSDMVASQPHSWISEVIRLGFTLYNYVRPMGRKLIRCSAGIRGNGMCFSTEIFRTIPWNTYSLNEDLEYGLILIQNGIIVDFAPEAQVIATMPTSARNAESQRTRWEKGRFHVINAYGWKLLALSIKKFSFKTFDAFVELITPPFVNLLGGTMSFFIINLIMLNLGIESAEQFVVPWLALIVLGILHVILGLYAAKADALQYKALFYIPRYVIWKLSLYLKLTQHGSTTDWVRTTREQSIMHKIADEDLK